MPVTRVVPATVEGPLARPLSTSRRWSKKDGPGLTSACMPPPIDVALAKTSACGQLVIPDGQDRPNLGVGNWSKAFAGSGPAKLPESDIRNTVHSNARCSHLSQDPKARPGGAKAKQAERDGLNGSLPSKVSTKCDTYLYSMKEIRIELQRSRRGL